MIKRHTNQGFVSLFTAILISLLLLVITLSMISIEALQLRKSEDAEQTLRAYYVAEAGVEDAVSKVLSMTPPYIDQTCSSKTDYIPGAGGWTCEQITFSGAPTGKLDADVAKTIDPGNATYGSVLIEWNQDSSISPCYYSWTCTTTAPWATAGGTFPSNAAFLANPKATPLEIAIVQYPSGGFAAGDPNLKLQNAVIVPGGGSGGTYGGDIDYRPGGTPNFPKGNPYKAKCNPTVGWKLPWGNNITSQYHCAAVLQYLNSGGGSNNYLFRIRSRYGASTYKMTFLSSQVGDGTSKQVNVPDGTATIDVTAKAGQTYRRVISKLPLSGVAAGELNYVMYSDTNICKDFDVINNVAQTGCPYP